MESELKLELDPATYQALLALPGPIDRAVEQVNTFYDSAARDLRRLGRALRLRRETGRAYLTVKGAAVRRAAGFFVRPESESELGPAEASRLAAGFRLSACQHAPVRELAALTGDLEVLPFCAFVNYRTRVCRADWTFDLDRTLMGGLVLCELEMEGADEGRDLQAWLRAQGFAFRTATRSKLEIAESVAAS